MRWRRFREEDAESIRRFLLPRETRCPAAVGRFLELNAARDRIWFASDRDSDPVRAFVFLGGGGALLPVLDADALSTGERERAVGALRRLLRFRRVHSVQAPKDDAILAEEALAALGHAEGERIDYALMALDGRPDEAALRAGPAALVVRRAGPNDADALFPLQASYEREEVVPRGAELNRAACRLALERTLACRLVLLAELDGQVVAKANTNARAFERDQVGGVYVVPEKRGLGIAQKLVAELVAVLSAEGRAASLFVKKRNEAAIAAYRRVGFRAGGEYRITYY